MRHATDTVVAAVFQFCPHVQTDTDRLNHILHERVATACLQHQQLHAICTSATAINAIRVDVSKQGVLEICVEVRRHLCSEPMR